MNIHRTGSETNTMADVDYEPDRNRTLKEAQNKSTNEPFPKRPPNPYPKKKLADADCSIVVTNRFGNECKMIQRSSRQMILFQNDHAGGRGL
jgi:hypothetical protein